MTPHGNHTYRTDEEGRWGGPCGTSANYWNSGRNKEASAQGATSQSQKIRAGTTTISCKKREVGATGQRTAFLCIPIAINKCMPRETVTKPCPVQRRPQSARGIIPCLSWMRGNC